MDFDIIYEKKIVSWSLSYIIMRWIFHMYYHPKVRKYKTRRFAHSHPPRINRHCRFGTGCSNGVGICIVCVGMVILVVLGLVFFGIFLQPCSNDLQCATNNYCSTDFCRDSFCRHVYKKDCCNNDKDCPKTTCHDTFCNQLLHKCTAGQTQNGGPRGGVAPWFDSSHT